MRLARRAGALVGALVALALLAAPGALATPLSDAAAGLAPGQWRELATGNIDQALAGTGGASGFIFGYTDSVKWDPVSKQILYVGGDHQANFPARFVAYSEDTNAWRRMPTEPWFATNHGHGYDHMAIDPAGRHFYTRQFNSRSLHRYDIDAGAWTALPDNDAIGILQCCGGVDWFPALGGLVWVDGGDQSVSLFSAASRRWSVIGKAPGIGPYHDVAEYNPVHKVVLLGGGNDPGARTLYRLAADRSITRLKDPPIPLGIQHSSVLTVDPVTGDYIVLTASHDLYSYDIVADAWKKLPAPPAGLWGSSGGVHGVMATPVSNHGVVSVLSCRGPGGDCTVHLYRHAAGTGAPVATTPKPRAGARARLGPPRRLRARALSSTAIRLTWRRPAGTVKPKAYRIMRNGRIVGRTARLRFVDRKVRAGLRYTYRVAAVNRAGRLGRWSRRVTARPGARRPVAGPPAAGGPAASADFAARCGSAGVVRCYGFDDAADLAKRVFDPSGNGRARCAGSRCWALDRAVAASGGSLRFEIPSKSAADTSGSFWMNFSEDLASQFGGGQEFFVQWRQRFSREFLAADYPGGGGWKQVIIGSGDQQGTPYYSCTDLEVVLVNGYHRGFPQMYNSCSGSASHGPFDGFEQPFGQYDFTLQNARPAPFCLYSQGKANPPAFFAPKGNCFGYVADEWMTFQVGITLGPRQGDEFVGSRIRLWLARDGRASEPVFDWGPYNLTAGDPALGQRFGKVWLLPYNTGKDATAAHAVGHTWYDELVVSRTRIADPVAATS